MRTRAATDELTSTTDGSPPAAAPATPPLRRTLRQRVADRVRGDYEEDGTFRPVRLSFWVDWGSALLIILFVVTCWVVFFTWLAKTQ